MKYVYSIETTQNLGDKEFTMREIDGKIGWNKKVAVFFAALALLVVLGPFATYEDLTLVERLIFWSISLAGAGFFMHFTIVTALSWSVLKPLPQVVRVACGSILGALPGTATVLFVDRILRPNNSSFDNFTIIWLQVALIGLFIGSVEFINWRAGERETIARTDIAETPRQVELLKRLPPELRSDINSLSMQDHYVEVSTNLGKHLVLMRFADALKELEGVEGSQIHRSHWAARHAASHLERKGGRNYLTLNDGTQLAVSGTHLDAAKSLLASSNEQ